MNDDNRSEDMQHQIEFIIEQQARFSVQMDRMQENAAKMQEAILGLIQVARTHDEQIDRNSEQIREINESLKEQREHINTLIRVVESHVSNHS